MKHVLIMGVCGSGKSSVGSALADRLGMRFLDADDFHPRSNVDHMRAGRPLDDAMRAGWLDALGQAVAGSDRPCVIACSALKRSYRERLTGHAGEMTVVHLTGERTLLEARVAARPGHFMPPSLVETQFADLEPPTGPAVTEIDVAQAKDTVLKLAHAFLTRARLPADG